MTDTWGVQGIQSEAIPRAPRWDSGSMSLGVSEEGSLERGPRITRPGPGMTVDRGRATSRPHPEGADAGGAVGDTRRETEDTQGKVM